MAAAWWTWLRTKLQAAVLVGAIMVCASYRHRNTTFAGRAAPRRTSSELWLAAEHQGEASSALQLGPPGETVQHSEKAERKDLSERYWVATIRSRTYVQTSEPRTPRAAWMEAQNPGTRNEAVAQERHRIVYNNLLLPVHIAVGKMERDAFMGLRRGMGYVPLNLKCVLCFKDLNHDMNKDSEELGKKRDHVHVSRPYRVTVAYDHANSFCLQLEGSAIGFREPFAWLTSRNLHSETECPEDVLSYHMHWVVKKHDHQVVAQRQMQAWFVNWDRPQQLEGVDNPVKGCVLCLKGYSTARWCVAEGVADEGLCIRHPKDVVPEGTCKDVIEGSIDRCPKEISSELHFNLLHEGGQRSTKMKAHLAGSVDWRDVDHQMRDLHCFACLILNEEWHDGGQNSFCQVTGESGLTFCTSARCQNHNPEAQFMEVSSYGECSDGGTRDEGTKQCKEPQSDLQYSAVELNAPTYYKQGSEYEFNTHQGADGPMVVIKRIKDYKKDMLGGRLTTEADRVLGFTTFSVADASGGARWTGQPLFATEVRVFQKKAATDNEKALLPDVSNAELEVHIVHEDANGAVKLVLVMLFKSHEPVEITKQSEMFYDSYLDELLPMKFHNGIKLRTREVDLNRFVHEDFEGANTKFLSYFGGTRAQPCCDVEHLMFRAVMPVSGSLIDRIRDIGSIPGFLDDSPASKCPAGQKHHPPTLLRSVPKILKKRPERTQEVKLSSEYKPTEDDEEPEVSEEQPEEAEPVEEGFDWDAWLLTLMAILLLLLFVLLVCLGGHNRQAAQLAEVKERVEKKARTAPRDSVPAGTCRRLVSSSAGSTGDSSSSRSSSRGSRGPVGSTRRRASSKGSIRTARRAAQASPALTFGATLRSGLLRSAARGRFRFGSLFSERSRALAVGDCPIYGHESNFNNNVSGDPSSDDVGSGADLSRRRRRPKGRAPRGAAFTVSTGPTTDSESSGGGAHGDVGTKERLRKLRAKRARKDRGAYDARDRPHRPRRQVGDRASSEGDHGSRPRAGGNSDGDDAGINLDDDVPLATLASRLGLPAGSKGSRGTGEQAASRGPAASSSSRAGGSGGSRREPPSGAKPAARRRPPADSHRSANPGRRRGGAAAGEADQTESDSDVMQ